MTFQDLNLITPILQALEKEGYTNPTPIQEQAIPPILLNKDILGCAQTGTGKTAAFAIPMLQKLHKQKDYNKRSVIKALILTPTRELAIQIDESFANYGQFLGLSHTVIFGGVKQGNQVNRLNKGVDILIATPGRLLDLVSQGIIRLNQIEIFVLDEADRMLDMGFINDVKKIIKELPESRQNLLFSATMPNEIVGLANNILKQPVRIEVTPVSSTVDMIQQTVCMVDQANKPSLLLHFLNNQGVSNVLVFTRTKHGADKIVKLLAKSNIKAAAIHGNKSQIARQNALNDFKSQKIKVLVATDIAARGIDIDGLSYVINYEIPNISETYVHRIGRTGRAGASGIAISFCAHEEKPYLKDIEKIINKKIPVNDVHPYVLAPTEAELNAALLKSLPITPKASSSNAPKKKKWFAKR